MKSILIAVSLLLLVFYNVNAQREDHNWLTGYQSYVPNVLEAGGTRLDFTKNPVEIRYDDRNINLFLAAGAMSDSLGSLMFYTNGICVGNRLNDTMVGGDTIFYDEYWERDREYGAMTLETPLILPYAEGKYKIIGHYDVRDDVNRVAWPSKIISSDVVFDAASPLGRMENRDFVVWDDTIDFAMDACRHGNGRDWWCVSMKLGADTLLCFLLSSDGFGPPQKQYFGVSLPFASSGGVCQSSFSPDGTKFVMYDAYNGLIILDFERCDGTFSNKRTIQLNSPVQTIRGGVAFSPNSRYLYYHHRNQIMQIDMQSPNFTTDTVAFATTLPNRVRTDFYSAQLGPDNRIYYMPGGQNRYFSVMESPDSAGRACKVVQQGLYLPTWNNGSLPNHPHYRLGALDGSACDTLGFNQPLYARTWLRSHRLDMGLVEIGQDSVAHFWLHNPGTDMLRLNGITASHGSFGVNPQSAMIPAADSARFEVRFSPTDTNGIVDTLRILSNALALETRVFVRGKGVENPTSISEPVTSSTWAEDILLYPNPAQDYLTIDAREVPLTGASYTLYDVLGRALLTGELLSQKQWLDLKGLPAGLYVVELRSEGSEGVKRAKIIKH